MAAACSPVLCWRLSVILLYTTSELPSSLTDEPRSDSIASYRGTALAPLWTLCGMKHSVSSYLLFLSQALIGLHRNLSFLTRIAWGFWGWFSIFWFFFFHILFWENIAGILWKAERVLSADCSIPCVTERPPGDTTPPSTSAFTVLFLGSGFACSLPWGTFCLQSSWGNSCSHPECRAQYCVFKP